jgi:hypothetical protein
MAPASTVFPDPSFLFQTPDENDEYMFHCIGKTIRERCNGIEIQNVIYHVFSFECEFFVITLFTSALHVSALGPSSGATSHTQLGPGD